MSAKVKIGDISVNGVSPSDGAHRLAHWLKAKGRNGWMLLRNGARVSATTVVRIFDGELTPLDEMRFLIARETEGAVMPGDWDAGGGKPWTDEPAARPGQPRLAA